MPYYSRNVSLAIDLETSLKGGTDAKITIGAATAGVLPLAVPTIAAAGSGYPASVTIPVRFVSTSVGSVGIATATGTITTNAGGGVTAATVTSGGAGYTNVGAAQFDVEGVDYTYGIWQNLAGGFLQDQRKGVLIGSDFDVKFNVIKIERDVLRGFMGGKETVPGSQWAEMTFTTELAPSGTKGVRPGWANLLKAAGFSEVFTINAGQVTKIDYAPVSDNFASLSMRALWGGARLNLKGARVSKMEIDLTVNTLPTCKWTVIGMIKDFVTGAFSNVDQANWAKPLVIMDNNTQDLKFGSAYNPLTGAITGGVAYPSKGVTISVENNAKFRPFLGGDSVPITQRESMGDFVADLTDVQRVDWWTRYSSNTVDSMAFSLGTTAGSILRVFTPNIELQEPRNVDDDGLLLTGTGFRCRPSFVNGNDEVRFVLM